ncbi:golvesin C-terminal-like domain-containing protein [Candidatus Viridilinea mediisalina]|uniref:Golvesin/Xly CBD-like domain-containing protein n=1 Tax=Candidatus Viridilinea mediisalina TaxID=2024553 RepID=A0A2A6RI22_9CHLR|nr:hypothetical protein [Candidatus Viridilinea mediisalina]PDW02529.1 hypothetical protein CJ255_13505 [Candidatus Viridilinea mediisalina]
MRTPLLWSRLAWALLIVLVALPASVAQAQNLEDATLHNTVTGLAQSDDVLSLADGSLTLAANALPPPAYLGSFQQYGVHTSATHRFALPTTRLALSYQANIPNGSAALVDVRGSVDGQRWLPWVTELAPGAVVGFSQPIRYAQYRVTMMGSFGLAPTVRGLSLATTNSEATVQAASVNTYAIAPTFRVRATRQGMVGGRTANGWIIPPRARFVALPSTTALSSRGGHEYQVRLTYRGRSVVVPVYDVGPHNIRDDYWNQVRRGFPDLPWGWPMDHAAFYQGYNGGRAAHGRVRFPTAVDVGDGAWLEDLGIVGDQAELEVTFLWLGQDPAAGPPVRDPAASEIVVDELDGDFWKSTLLGASAMGCGENHHAYWARAVPEAQAAPVGRWQPRIPVEGQYDVYVHVPICPSRTAALAQARYIINHRDGALEVLVNQRTQTSWVHLGRYTFAEGNEGFVQLGAVGERGATVWFDKVKWVRVGQ